MKFHPIVTALWHDFNSLQMQKKDRTKGVELVQDSKFGYQSSSLLQPVMDRKLRYLIGQSVTK